MHEVKGHGGEEVNGGKMGEGHGRDGEEESRRDDHSEDGVKENHTGDESCCVLMEVVAGGEAIIKKSHWKMAWLRLEVKVHKPWGWVGEWCM